MKTEIKTSAYRMLLDLVKSDEIITVEELDGLDEACAAYGLDDADKEAGSRMTLSEAVAHISTQSTRFKEGLRKTMLDIAIKDGECCRSESLMLTMMDYICDGKGAKVVSMEYKNRNLLDTQILYLEDTRTTASRNILDEDFEELENIVKLGGLELIYIPKISEHFREHDSNENLRRLLSIVSPQSDRNDLENTIAALKGMNTRFFYNNVIRGKLDMDIKVDDPAWIIRIPDSTVDSVKYVNFLCLKAADDDIRRQLVEFVSRLNSRQGSYTVKVNDAKGRGNSFIYNGFYKALLDLMSVRKIDKWDIHIRLYGYGADMFRYQDSHGSWKKCVMSISKDGEEQPIPLTGRDVAFYLLLLCASADPERGGVDFHDKSLEERTQNEYARLFHAVSRRTEEPLVWDPVFRTPMRSRIGTALNDSGIARISSLQSVYLPQEKRRGFLYVPIEPERVFIHTASGTFPLMESCLYDEA